jgi:plastocyanin
MRRVAGRMQTVGAGMLVLAATVAAPALSAAQQGADPNAEPADPALTTPAPPTAPPGEPAQPEEGAPQDQASEPEQVVSEAPAQVTAPQPNAAPEKQAKPAASKSVSVGDNFYAPETVTINVGDTVTWNNDGAAEHSATADDGSFDTGTFPGGQSRSETFTSAGTIPYFCTVHGQAQSGTVRVLSAGGGGGDGGGGTSSSGSSEAAAVSSPGAAGSSTSLPATGFGAIVLAAVGMALLGSGSALRHHDQAREAGRRRPARFFSF